MSEYSSIIYLPAMDRPYIRSRITWQTMACNTGSSLICKNIQEHVTHTGRQQTSVEVDHHLASDLPTRYNILISPSWLPYMPCRVVTGLSNWLGKDNRSAPRQDPGHSLSASPQALRPVPSTATFSFSVLSGNKGLCRGRRRFEALASLTRPSILTSLLSS